MGHTYDHGHEMWPIVCALSFCENPEENNMDDMMDYGTHAVRIIFALKTWNGLLALRYRLGRVEKGRWTKGTSSAVAHFWLLDLSDPTRYLACYISGGCWWAPASNFLWFTHVIVLWSISKSTSDLGIYLLFFLAGLGFQWKQDHS